jgi:hypothetical protein
MRRTVAVGSVLLAGCVLAGCGNVRDTLGLGKNPPDEFAVVTRAPLSLPPTYDLRAPEPGAPRPQEATSSAAARAALVGQIPPQSALQSSEGLKPVTVQPVAGQGEQALLSRAGAGKASDAVRADVDRETAQIESVNASLLAQIQQTTVTPDPLVDAGRESQRVRGLKQQNAPVSGDAAAVTPVKKPTLWDRFLAWF